MIYVYIWLSLFAASLVAELWRRTVVGPEGAPPMRWIPSWEEW